jgi:predicted Zn finger-like uncharacterized protein
MPFHTECPDCEASYHLPDEQEGRRVRCKQCEAVFTAEPINDSDPAHRAGKASRSGARAGTAAQGTAAKLKELPLPWIVGGAVACVGLLVAGAIIVALILKPAAPAVAVRKDSDRDRTAFADAPPVPVPMPQPFTPPTPPPPTEAPVAPAPAPLAAPPPAAVVVVAPPAPPPAGAGARLITPDARDRVKHATVYIQVTFPDGRKASGSGFFGARESPNIVLTNAHVLGMLAPESHAPKNVEVVINSGEANMKRTTARVLGVDRQSDLAVLDVGKVDGLPAPLDVKSASSLQLLDRVYVFGFPYGKTLGEEMTIRDSSVSAFRKRNGIVDKVQVNGGMDHGNSGGPVVDGGGDVVGVAVSGVEGTNINFAIPGERVTSMLGGQLSSRTIGLPWSDAGRVTLPVQLEMIDINPKEDNRIKTVSLDVWTGPRGEGVGEGTKEPPARAGDSPRRRVEMSYSGGTARAEVQLPELPKDRVYWLQPVFVTGKTTRWATAFTHEFKPDSVIERKPANLRFRPSNGSSRLVSIKMSNSFRVTADEDSAAVVTREADLQERVVGSDSENTVLKLEYKRLKHDLKVNKDRPVPDPRMLVLEPFLPFMVEQMRVDPKGNPRSIVLDVPPKSQNGILGILTRAPGAAGKLGTNLGEVLKSMAEIALPAEHALNALAVTLPNEDNCQPGKSWYASSDRTLPLETVRSLLSENEYNFGVVKLTYTYLGMRTGKGKPVAVIGIEGSLGDKDGGESMSGQVSGIATVDIATGVATHAELSSMAEVEGALPGKGGRAIGTFVLTIDRAF